MTKPRPHHRPRPARPATPYDDPVGYERRWGRLDDEARHREADRDPLVFLADHLPATDRGPGRVTVALDLGAPGRRLVNPVPGLPADPSPLRCRLVLDPFAAVAAEVRADVAPRLGVLHHRPGPAHPTDLDRRWAQALAEVVEEYGLTSLGVVARTEAGALVRLGAATAAA